MQFNTINKYLLRVVLVIVLFQAKVHAQTSLIDSLENRLQLTTNDSAIVMLKTAIAREFIYLDIDKSEVLIQQALSLATEKQFIYEKAYALRIMGAVLRERGAYLEGANLIMQAIKIFEESNDLLGLGNCYISLGHVYHNLEDFETAVEIWRKAVHYIELTGLRDRIGVATYNLARGYYDLGKMDSALVYMEKSRVINEEINNLNVLQSIQLLQVAVYYDLGDYEKSIDAINKIFKIIDNNNIAQGQAITEAYFFKALINMKRGEIDSAELNFQRSMSHALTYGYLDIYTRISTELIKYYSGSDTNYKKLTSTIINHLNITDSLLKIERKNRVQVVKWHEERAKNETEIKQFNKQIDSYQMGIVYLILLIVLAGIIIFYVVRFSKTIKNQNELLENQKKELEEANKAKNKLFSIISHDLIGPIGAIHSITELLLNDDFEPNKIKDVNVELNITSKNLLGLARDLLDWARVHMDTLNPVLNVFNVAESIDGVVDNLKQIAKNKKVGIVCKYNEQHLVHADSSQIGIVVRNLLSNSIKFTPENGEISVNISEEEQKVRIIVTDNGVGMSKDQLDQLFEVSRNKSTRGTAGEKGTGLGLILCKEFIDKNGGEIQVESKKGEGSKFTIILPSGS